MDGSREVGNQRIESPKMTLRRRTDNTKDGGTGAVGLLCSFYHDPLGVQIIEAVFNFAV